MVLATNPSLLIIEFSKEDEDEQSNSSKTVPEMWVFPLSINSQV